MSALLLIRWVIRHDSHAPVYIPLRGPYARLHARGGTVFGWACTTAQVPFKADLQAVNMAFCRTAVCTYPVQRGTCCFVFHSTELTTAFASLASQYTT